MRLLRSQSSTETAAFWTVLILSYLTLSILAGVRGIGYSERVDAESKSITFELNSFLWLPDAFLHADPSTNPLPFMLWWVVIATFAAVVVIVVYRRFFRPAARTAMVTQSPPSSRPQESDPR